MEQAKPEKTYTGTISFVHHQKHYATIDYRDGDKKKTINFQMNLKEKPASPQQKKIKKHQYRTGDTVKFQLQLTPRGDRLNATNIKFLYNNDLDRLVQKAKTDNLFKGFLKIVDDAFFVKEIGSYLFFPLILSPWERKPSEQTEAVDFRLINTDKSNIAAELARPSFIPEYRSALKLYKDKTAIEATVTKVSPYAVYVDVIGNAIQAKIPLTEIESKNLKPGYKLMVRIKYLSPAKIVVEVA